MWHVQRPLSWRKRGSFKDLEEEQCGQRADRQGKQWHRVNETGAVSEFQVMSDVNGRIRYCGSGSI